jgi:hypothetical protein
MSGRRWFPLLVAVGAVTALAGVLALDRSAAADWDTGCAAPTVTCTETSPPSDPLNPLRFDGLNAAGPATQIVAPPGLTVPVTIPDANNTTAVLDRS